MRATAMNDAPIEIEPYSEKWPRLFELEAESLSDVLRSWLVGAIEHIGSTAVPGLSAKPVIDIMAPVSTLAQAEPAINTLSAFGYCYFPYKADVMHWFCKPSPAHRTHHLHLVPAGSTLWVQRIAFRDYLRENATLATEYQALKRRLAHDHFQDREAYTEGKSPFIQSVLSRAGAGAA
jgi:GrpB-like predicted nucleotidyltransferase (UPF0157 family)